MTRKSADLVLHAGAQVVTRDLVRAVPTPEATDTWTPVPHADLIDLTLQNFTDSGLAVIEERHGLYKEGARYFGVFKLGRVLERAPLDGEGDIVDPFGVDRATPDFQPPDWSMAVGLRNSHDKSFPANLLGGSWVFVCDNLAFNGEIKLVRRHTRNIMRDIPNLVSRAVAALVNGRHAMAQRIEAYKDTSLTDPQAHDLLVRALDARALTTTQLPKVLGEWREPRHEEFAPRNAWSFVNAATEVLKESPALIPARTMALHGVVDRFAGVLEGLDLNG
jgi:hypothetical protein